MRGVITAWDVFANVGVVWREFGALCVFRCFAAAFRRRKTTFLEIAFRRSLP